MSDTSLNMDLQAREIASRITMTVNLKGMKVWSVRLKIAAFLVWVASIIAGMNYEEE